MSLQSIYFKYNQIQGRLNNIGGLKPRWGLSPMDDILLECEFPFAWPYVVQIRISRGLNENIGHE